MKRGWPSIDCGVSTAPHCTRISPKNVSVACTSSTRGQTNLMLAEEPDISIVEVFSVFFELLSLSMLCQETRSADRPTLDGCLSKRLLDLRSRGHRSGKVTGTRSIILSIAS